jgi:hypothetical protein
MVWKNSKLCGDAAKRALFGAESQIHRAKSGMLGASCTVREIFVPSATLGQPFQGPQFLPSAFASIQLNQNR